MIILPCIFFIIFVSLNCKVLQNSFGFFSVLERKPVQMDMRVSLLEKVEKIFTYTFQQESLIILPIPLNYLLTYA